MLRLILSRLLAAIPVMGVVAIFVFLLLRLSPGDPAAILAGDTATAENIAAIRADLGLDRPIPEQFVTWIGQLLQGDLGKSVLSKQPVAQMIEVMPALARSSSSSGSVMQAGSAAMKRASGSSGKSSPSRVI